MIGLSRPTTVFLLTTWLLSQLFAQSHADEQPNVLFIAVDDLNDWVGCLGGHPNAKTPNIDRLAERGMLFTNATCPSPICNPSRTSIMTGMLPSTTGIYMNHPFFRDVPQLRDAVTLLQYFRQHGGYKTLRTGKIYHHSKAPTDPASWDEAFPSLHEHKPVSSAPSSWDYLNKAALWDTGPLALTDEEMDDGLVANWAIEQLGKTHETRNCTGVSSHFGVNRRACR